MSLGSGARLGPYEILSPLGAGGMGEVYRARDTKLGRDVALKILPESFTHDPERIARFRREAQVLAALNHPHIGAIYGLDDANGQQFLVLEVVDGESLDRRIARGPIPVDEALPIAKQIAEALEAAHEKGIIHRDLKPANIALTHDGQVKVLDFGLAKATETASGSSGDLANSPTITSPAMMTGVGVILGTAAYMSPEQAKGRAADKRSDMWAFGCVLYEMLTGKRAFAGEDVSDTLAAVLRGEPDWTTLPTDTPGPIRRLLRRCLAKDRTRRLADAADARLEIDEALTAPTGDADLVSVTRHRAAWRRAILVLVLLAHDRRRIRHVAVTAHPTAAWTAQQLREAFPWDEAPRYLLHDRDHAFDNLRASAKAMGIEDVLTAPCAPWQNPFVERFIGSARRECFEHVIVFNEAGLKRLITLYCSYYEKSRTHLALDKDAPIPRPVLPPGDGDIVAIPEVGGLHHRYERRAA